jgi:hypothetical protein
VTDEKRLVMIGMYLTELDEREVKQEVKRYGRANIYRLGHYLGAANRVRDRVAEGTDFATAFTREFVPTRGTHWVARKLELPLDVDRGQWVSSSVQVNNEYLEEAR